MNLESQNPAIEPRNRLSKFLDWWFAPRLRALITWLVLAFVSGLLLEDLHLHRQLNGACAVVTQTFAQYTGFSPSMPTVVTVSYLALFTWFQPVALRIGVIRGVAWIFVQCFLGTVVLYTVGDVSTFFSFGYLCGISGLLISGIRTRPWMTFVAGAASALICLALGWKSFPVRQGDLKYLVLLSNFSYAAVMLYGTRLISSQSDHDEEDDF